VGIDRDLRIGGKEFRQRGASASTPKEMGRLSGTIAARGFVACASRPSSTASPSAQMCAARPRDLAKPGVVMRASARLLLMRRAPSRASILLTAFGRWALKAHFRRGPREGRSSTTLAKRSPSKVRESGHSSNLETIIFDRFYFFVEAVSILCLRTHGSYQRKHQP